MKIKSLMAAIIMFVMAAQIQAQPGRGQNQTNQDFKKGEIPLLNKLPNVTEDQRVKITDLHTKMLKTIQPLQNQVGEKRAKIRTLKQQDNPNLDEINKLIDEVSDLHVKIEKERVKFYTDVRKLLTDEQKVAMDRGPRGKGGQGCGSGGGKGKGCNNECRRGN